MKWWIWLLLILVLLSLVAVVVLLLWLCRRRKEAGSKSARVIAPPAEPTRAVAAVEAEEAVEEMVAKVEPTAVETAVEAEEAVEEMVAKVEPTAVETAVEVEQAVEEAVAEVEETAVETAQEIAEPMASRVLKAVPAAPPPPDDLTVIEGIGPKISSVFQAAGITTLTQLAATDADTLKRILTEAKIRLGDPGTWPEQAALAAEAKWDELTVLQDTLKGGRRV